MNNFKVGQPHNERNVSQKANKHLSYFSFSYVYLGYYKFIK